MYLICINIISGQYLVAHGAADVSRAEVLDRRLGGEDDNHSFRPLEALQLYYLETD